VKLTMVNKGAGEGVGGRGRLNSVEGRGTGGALGADPRGGSPVGNLRRFLDQLYKRRTNLILIAYAICLENLRPYTHSETLLDTHPFGQTNH